MGITTIQKLRTKKNLHLARKVWHIGGVGALIWVLLTLDYDKLIAFGLLATSSILFLDLMRLNFPKFNKTSISIMGLFMREEERKSFSGMSFLAVGALLLCLIFPKEIVLLALMFLCLGDPLGSIVGVLFGKTPIGKKSLEGSLAVVATCFAISFGYLFIKFGFEPRFIFLSFTMGLLGGLSELIQIPKIDDNFSFPLFSGLGIWLLSLISGVGIG